MSEQNPTSAGWYPDAATGGTRYWDGARWTGDGRPQRRSFAAAAAHRGWGIGLTIFGVLSVLTSPGQLDQTSVDEASTTSPVGQMVFAIVLGIGLTAWGVYLLRGQGPTTKDVEARAAAHRASENLGRFVQSSSRAQAVVVNVGAHDRGDAVEVAKVNALASPETAKALQNLQNLLYSRTISDAEFQAAKDRLLGGAERASADLPVAQRHAGGVRDEAPDRQLDGTEPLHTVEAEIGGRPATVRIFRDRLEWVSRTGVSAGKIAGGVLTGGVSLAVTGVGKGSYGAGRTAGAETIPMSAITHVVSQRRGGRTDVSLTTPRGVLTMRLAHHEVPTVQKMLNVLVAEATRDAGAPAAVHVHVGAASAGPGPGTAPAVPTHDSIEQIARLAELHRTGALNDAEFTAAKARVLGL